MNIPTYVAIQVLLTTDYFVQKSIQLSIMGHKNSHKYGTYLYQMLVLKDVFPNAHMFIKGGGEELTAKCRLGMKPLLFLF